MRNETAKKLQMIFLYQNFGKEVGQVSEVNIIGESLVILWPCSDKMMDRRKETSEMRQSAGKMTRLQGKYERIFQSRVEGKCIGRDTGSYLQEEIIPVDLVCLVRCHGCSRPERAYTYSQPLSVTYKEDDEQYNIHLCKNCFLQREEGKAKRFHQALKAYQQEQRTRSTMEIGRGMHGITFEVLRTFQQERIRAKQLLAMAANAFVERVNCI